MPRSASTPARARARVVFPALGSPVSHTVAPVPAPGAGPDTVESEAAVGACCVVVTG